MACYTKTCKKRLMAELPAEFVHDLVRVTVRDIEIVKSGTELTVRNIDLALTSVAEWPATQTCKKRLMAELPAESMHDFTLPLAEHKLTDGKNVKYKLLGGLLRSILILFLILGSLSRLQRNLTNSFFTSFPDSN